MVGQGSFRGWPELRGERSQGCSRMGSGRRVGGLSYKHVRAVNCCGQLVRLLLFAGHRLLKVRPGNYKHVGCTGARRDVVDMVFGLGLSIVSGHVAGATTQAKGHYGWWVCPRRV